MNAFDFYLSNVCKNNGCKSKWFNWVGEDPTMVDDPMEWDEYLIKGKVTLKLLVELSMLTLAFGCRLQLQSYGNSIILDIDSHAHIKDPHQLIVCGALEHK